MKKGRRIAGVLSIILSFLTLFLIAPLLLGYIPVGTRENLTTTTRTTSLPAAAEAASPDNPKEQFERAKKVKAPNEYFDWGADLRVRNEPVAPLRTLSHCVRTSPLASPPFVSRSAYDLPICVLRDIPLNWQ